MLIDVREKEAQDRSKAVMLKIASVLEGTRLDDVAGALASLLLGVGQQLIQRRKQDRIISAGAAGDDAIIRGFLRRTGELLMAMSEAPDPQLLPSLRDVMAQIDQKTRQQGN